MEEADEDWMMIRMVGGTLYRPTCVRWHPIL